MKTVQEIYNDMKQYIADTASMTLNDGGDMAIRLLTAAHEMQSLWAQTEFVLRQTLPQTASGESLDAHAEMRGLTRKAPACAVGYISFSLNAPSASDVGVPIGTRCLTDAMQEFETTEPGYIGAGLTGCTVSAQAVVPGSAGNVPTGSIVYMENAPVSVAACINQAPFRGGRDAESDEELRARIVNSYRRLSNGANAAFYEETALDVEGVTQALVIPRSHGIGTADVVITGVNAIPSAALIAAVQDKLDDCREICVDITVRGPTQVTVPVTLTVTVRSGYDEDEVCEAVENALTERYSGAKLGEDLRLADISEAAYSVPGVKSFTIDNLTDDVAIDADEVLIVHATAVSEE